MMQKEFRKLLLAAGGALCFGGSFGQQVTLDNSSGSCVSKCAAISMSASALEEALGMVLVEGSGEYPNHISSFYMGKYEVTQRLWTAVMGTTIEEQQAKAGGGTRDYGRGDDYPMYWVSWKEAMEFARRVSFVTGRSYRLPTEAEWEYAAKGGNSPHGYTYAGSSNADEVAWHHGNSRVAHEVGKKKDNGIGLYDMTGNVWEWCYENHSTVSSNRVIRGGSWYDDAFFCRVAYRNYDEPGFRSYNLGFRLACSSD